jgi:hypothetical protein
MRWPFRAKQPECDVRVFRAPKTGKLTLRLQGDVGFPFGWEQPILTLEIRLDAAMSDEIAEQVRDQLLMLLPPYQDK